MDYLQKEREKMVTIVNTSYETQLVKPHKTNCMPILWLQSTGTSFVWMFTRENQNV